MSVYVDMPVLWPLSFTQCIIMLIIGLAKVFDNHSANITHIHVHVRIYIHVSCIILTIMYTVYIQWQVSPDSSERSNINPDGTVAKYIQVSGIEGLALQ